ncbi:MAG: M48 family metalloprotease, partial [Armatimonadota bacterium]
MNTLKTALLMIVLTGLFVLIGDQVAGTQGMIIALVLAAGMNFISYWYSDTIVLKMYGAREVSDAEAPRLHGIVRNLAQKAGIPVPRVHIIPHEAPNAFATGRDPEHAAVAVTQGILQILNDRELEGVLAHEISHVDNRDMLISTIAATMAGALMLLARMVMFAGMFFGGSRRGRGGLGVMVLAIVGAVAALLI